ncbi:DUF4252 domain-containing protein [Ancylomarina euxinus]|uniref:DUF4252 domain-containing protein n=1 Tax=Ancylomarina euxinus TaxID=2283627 RepID=A0A425Y8E1_9BACT|nr:DUF4252 domain-containing protein [Ancylomarina euxinus]MCZ4693413.1 DUF4252 domain-containing protein [Ancylomarina euxinus]MUP13640.1 DUF4252 domain-containing protein [Ancylomarina euxinus]RRG24718.1 DUF4252 domain-containing protein [Ancylomarina euxinus]
MKQLVIILMVILFPVLVQAQTKGEKIHEKYSKLDEFSSFGFSGDFLKNLDFDVDEDEVEKNITGDCDGIKLLSYKHEDGRGTKFKKHVISELTSGKYKQVLKDVEEDDDSDEVYFFALGNKKRFSEFHLLHCNGTRTSLVSFFGDFHTDELKSLSRYKFDK